MSDTFLIVLEILGTIAFAVSGVTVGMQKQMDLFGITVMGLVTSLGGGITRDMLLGIHPPLIFRSPMPALIALIVSLVMLLPIVRKLMSKNQAATNFVLLLMDSLGLGVFTVVGVQVTVNTAPEYGILLQVFIGTVTAVGGGVLRDVLAGTRPYIFVRHFYACAAMIGALICSLLWPILGSAAAMSIGAVAVTVLRLLAARYRWDLPRITDFTSKS